MYADNADNAANVRISTRYLNDYELQQVASSPYSTHYFKLDRVSDIALVTGKMAAETCEEPAAIDPGEDYETEIEDGDARYFKPVCPVMTTKVSAQSVCTTALHLLGGRSS